MGAGKTVRGVVEGDADRDVFIPQFIALHQVGCFPFGRLVRFYPLGDHG